MSLFLLYENASGYALFERLESEEIGAMASEVIQAQAELARFSKLVTLKAFQPFTSAEQALENQNDVSEGIDMFGIEFYDRNLEFYFKNFFGIEFGKSEAWKIDQVFHGCI